VEEHRNCKITETFRGGKTLFNRNYDTTLDSFFGFLGGDRYNSPFSTWVHYAQLAFIGVCSYIILFCGCKTGG
jgi:hypothetical protein